MKKQGGDGGGGGGGSKPKRKKTTRACIHCQRAHVTCDEGRPCQRCIKKKCESTCADGVRKQAKYLQDSDVSSTRPHHSLHTNNGSSSTNWALPNLSASMQLPGYLPPTPPNPIPHNNNNNNNNNKNNSIKEEDKTAAPLRTSNKSFTSHAANSEYSILSSILQNTDNNRFNPIDLGTTMSTPDSDSPSMAKFEEWMMDTTRNNAQMISSPVEETHPEEVYSRVKQPYPYTQGYHALIAYLRSRFDKHQLMHMAHAMATYRPSFIATTKTLKEEDLIFMEKCFQRTLLEFEKFIAASGTPTVVWRRTGQIAAVGKEFCILTEWSKERLLNQQTFIVELMDDSSVVSYFDLFSRMAFGDSRGVTMSECTLLKPNGTKVPAACTWTVKRDVFDIPMMIIGNFLPILF